MSFRLFEQGIPAEEIQKMKQAGKAEDYAMEALRKWKESEHVLNILRTIKASEGALDKMVMKKWQEAISGKI